MEMKKTIRVGGMSCGHCVGRVQRALAGVEGVKDVFVDLASATATLDAGRVPDTVLRDVVEEAGYDVLSIDMA